MLWWLWSQALEPADLDSNPKLQGLGMALPCSGHLFPHLNMEKQQLLGNMHVRIKRDSAGKTGCGTWHIVSAH